MAGAVERLTEITCWLAWQPAQHEPHIDEAGSTVLEDGHATELVR